MEHLVLLFTTMKHVDNDVSIDTIKQIGLNQVLILPVGGLFNFCGLIQQKKKHIFTSRRIFENEYIWEKDTQLNVNDVIFLSSPILN